MQVYIGLGVIPSEAPMGGARIFIGRERERKKGEGDVCKQQQIIAQHIITMYGCNIKNTNHDIKY